MLFSWAAVVMTAALVAAILGWSTFAVAAVGLAGLLVASALALFVAELQRSRRVARGRPTSSSPTLEGEVARGAALGVVVAAALAHALGAPYAGTALAGSGGAFVGAVVGLLVWIGSADLPEDRIPAPRRSRHDHRG